LDPAHRRVHLRDKTVVLELWVAKHLAHVVHSTARDAGGFEPLEPHLRRMGRERLGKRSLHLAAVGHPPLVGAEALVREEIRPLDHVEAKRAQCPGERTATQATLYASGLRSAPRVRRYRSAHDR